MKGLQYMIGKEWTLTPAGGSTGEAYYAQSGEKRLFLKRNSSPFLAVLSAEGIVPKLIWTKRLENGDVITAQKWLEGRELTSEEMKHPRVAKLLSKIHHSPELLDMLMRIGKQPINPEDIVKDLKDKWTHLNISDYPIELDRAYAYLVDYMSEVTHEPQVVCHCDMNHNNWFLTDDNKLYLIDWDNAKVGDPALDIGMLLHNYIPESEWDTWLESYGSTRSDRLLKRMYWYLIAETISLYTFSCMKKEEREAAQYLGQLKRLMVKTTVY